MSTPTVGQPAPDFEVKTDSGETIKLADFRGKSVVLYFYPRADTPGCTIQSCAFRDDFGKFVDKNAVILGASPDTVEDQAAFKAKFNLPFTLLADLDHAIAEAYGAWGTFNIVRDGQTIERTGIQRSSFIIDENGTISGVFMGVDPTTNSQEMLEKL